jgi:hypothetical protein
VARSRVELFEAIRRDHRREGLSVRGLADRYRVHRRAVRQALACAEPPRRKTPVRAAPRLDPAKALIDAMLREDLDAPRKQRHTARRVSPVGFQNSAGGLDVRFYAARSYSLISPPRIGRRLICWQPRSGAA